MSLDVMLYIEVDLGGPELHRIELFSANITHNLNAMWRACGVYDALYHRGDEEVEARTKIPAFEQGLAQLETYPDIYRQYDAPNGRGTYEHAVPFLRSVLEACKTFPKALYEVSR